VRIKVAGIVLAVALAATACGGNGGGPDTTSAPKAGGALKVAAALPPSSLDPIAGTNGGDQVSLYPIYDRLINLDPAALTPQPGLATAWKYTDPKTLVLTLRDGVTFHDGTPFNAEAVKFNLERDLDPAVSKNVSDLSNIESVDATGPHEVTIHLKQPDASLVLTLADRAGMVVSPAAVQKWGKAYNQHPVGTGAYTFGEYVPNDHLLVKKNDHYWQAGKPYLDQITFKYITDQRTRNNALQAHDVDLVFNINLADLSTLKTVSGIQVVSAPSLLIDGCYVNFSREPFNKLEARRALAIAIDRDELNKSLAFGQAKPTSEIFPAGYWAADPSLNDTFAYNADKARDLLKQAGYANGLSIKGLVFQDTAEVRKSEIIQAQLKKVGINMTFDVYDAATVAKKFFTEKGADFVCASWSGRPDPSQTAGSLLSAKSFYNAGNYAAPGMADALSAAAAAQSQDARKAAFSKVIQLNQEYVMWIPLLNEPNVTAVSGKVKGATPSLYGKMDISFLSLSQ
jgi:peptide/nickel transport system substrate-binding protein